MNSNFGETALSSYNIEHSLGNDLYNEGKGAYG